MHSAIFIPYSPWGIDDESPNSCEKDINKRTICINDEGDSARLKYLKEALAGERCNSINQGTRVYRLSPALLSRRMIGR